MSAPTQPRSAAYLLQQAHGKLLGSCAHLADAINLGEGLDEGTRLYLQTVHHVLLAEADRQEGVLRKLTPKPPRLELIPGGIQSAGMCPECGRIGDHQPRCPEVSQ